MFGIYTLLRKDGSKMILRQTCNRGQLAGYEALIILVLLASTGGLFYLYAHKPTNASIYQSGSKPTVTPIDNSPHFGCVNVKVEEMMDARNNPTAIKR